MRYAVILAGGSGTRLWPMSRGDRPKQLLPLAGGRSLLQLAYERFEGLIPLQRRYVCASAAHRPAIAAALPALPPAQYLAEPTGRDTLAAVGLAAAVLALGDAEAVVGVFTADHLIEPAESFRRIVAEGFALAESRPRALVTFGIAPTYPATGYGYLELAEPRADGARRVRRFREKPPQEQAAAYVAAGAERYLWNSGMFVWRAATLLDCIARYRPELRAGLAEIAAAWQTPSRTAVLERVYPGLTKISVDFGVMEPAAEDAAVEVAAIPMPLAWLDVGAWPAYAQAHPRDAAGNAVAAKAVLSQTRRCLVASDDPEHLVAVVGCDDLIVVHAGNATLVCRADMAEEVKELQRQIADRFGRDYA